MFTIYNGYNGKYHQQSRGFGGGAGAAQASGTPLWMKGLGAFVFVNFLGQVFYGGVSERSRELAFEQKWMVYDKDPYKIQEFYQGEDLLQVHFGGRCT